ncbi:DUF1330 domain-containing protein [Hyunsoonleella pacifica]|uniref:DUF1330 domain-containing protein n=1 Tax=Hyunsoonleella pacifica TaxID=1080224 RepID=A0A4Q9FPW5_9FLAO|nr:DUF1330 domain-containing protein [Hyunsoonleella pacifica]TBN14732.1 DUF1330 domain-containing protein [Hyunsoonleella pacifica]GGD16216.1 hypothetical protein GCM10011368_17750 [Hyunsoonleella pacifica]
MIYITAFLFINEEKKDLYNQYESEVLPLLKNYKGKLIYRIQPNDDNYINVEEEKPFEIHFISFENEKGFTRFLNDKKRLSFNHLKEASIRTSFIVKGKKL